MPVVYVADQGSAVSKKGDRLYVFRGTQLLRWFHTKDISQLIILGNVSLTTPVITYLLKYKIDTVFLSYYGKFKGRLVGEAGKNVQLRVDQFAYLADLSNRMELARLYIQAKIANMQIHLYKRRRRQKDDLITTVIVQNNAILKKLESSPGSLEILRGYEGIASKNYFSCFPRLIKNPDFPFSGRNRRPPKDEVNALLSLCYTLLMNQVMTQTYIVGLDPYYGALHDLDYGRQSLVLDLLEEFRPLVDNLVISLINKREIRKEHFVYNVIPNMEDDPELEEKGSGLPVSLSSDGMKIVVYAFSALMNSKLKLSNPDSEWNLRDIILLQARKLASHFKLEKVYEAFQWQ